jgi:hypothetical protein
LSALLPITFPDILYHPFPNALRKRFLYRGSWLTHKKSYDVYWPPPTHRTGSYYWKLCLLGNFQVLPPTLVISLKPPISYEIPKKDVYGRVYGCASAFHLQPPLYTLPRRWSYSTVWRTYDGYSPQMAGLGYYEWEIYNAVSPSWDCEGSGVGQNIFSFQYVYRTSDIYYHYLVASPVHIFCTFHYDQSYNGHYVVEPAPRSAKLWDEFLAKVVH